MIDFKQRAHLSQGMSSNPLYQMVSKILSQRHSKGGILVDIGCGEGNLWKFVCKYFEQYIGVDCVDYKNFDYKNEFVLCDLDAEKIQLADNCADVVISIETIEHLENPRFFVRELTRLAKPGGLIIITTPNQLSLLSKLTLLMKNQFNAFQEAPGLYPAHITHLLEIDLVRIGKECGLEQIQISYTNRGRIPFSNYYWPERLGFVGRSFSDNIGFSSLKPLETI